MSDRSAGRREKYILKKKAVDRNAPGCIYFNMND